ncbi:hypothetical protein VP01_1311g1 [Puccinia sorghi]|uniref:Uncharacterized protein n=1 Tax=Puccinia sorghi TaxID=27349 RepID=A0A0L6VPM0_9BASI|nr:hypothetical protein VP01_1311g1 [Puccinia sorghi]
MVTGGFGLVPDDCLFILKSVENSGPSVCTGLLELPHRQQLNPVLAIHPIALAKSALKVHLVHILIWAYHHFWRLNFTAPNKSITSERFVNVLAQRGISLVVKDSRKEWLPFGVMTQGTQGLNTWVRQAVSTTSFVLPPWCAFVPSASAGESKPLSLPASGKKENRAKLGTNQVITREPHIIKEDVKLQCWTLTHVVIFSSQQLWSQFPRDLYSWNLELSPHPLPIISLRESTFNMWPSTLMLLSNKKCSHLMAFWALLCSLFIVFDLHGGQMPVKGLSLSFLFFSLNSGPLLQLLDCQKKYLSKPTKIEQLASWGSSTTSNRVVLLHKYIISALVQLAIYILPYTMYLCMHDVAHRSAFKKQRLHSLSNLDKHLGVIFRAQLNWQLRLATVLVGEILQLSHLYWDLPLANCRIRPSYPDSTMTWNSFEISCNLESATLKTLPTISIPFEHISNFSYNVLLSVCNILLLITHKLQTPISFKILGIPEKKLQNQSLSVTLKVSPTLCYPEETTYYLIFPSTYLKLLLQQPATQTPVNNTSYNTWNFTQYFNLLSWTRKRDHCLCIAPACKRDLSQHQSDEEKQELEENSRQVKACSHLQPLWTAAAWFRKLDRLEWMFVASIGSQLLMCSQFRSATSTSLKRSSFRICSGASSSVASVGSQWLMLGSFRLSLCKTWMFSISMFKLLLCSFKSLFSFFSYCISISMSAVRGPLQQKEIDKQCAKLLLSSFFSRGFEVQGQGNQSAVGPRIVAHPTGLLGKCWRNMCQAISIESASPFHFVFKTLILRFLLIECSFPMLQLIQQHSKFVLLTGFEESWRIGSAIAGIHVVHLLQVSTWKHRMMEPMVTHQCHKMCPTLQILNCLAYIVIDCGVFNLHLLNQYQCRRLHGMFTSQIPYIGLIEIKSLLYGHFFAYAASHELIQATRAIRDNNTLTHICTNLLTPPFQNWLIALKIHHSKLPNHNVISSNMLNTQARWEIGLFSDELSRRYLQHYKLTIKEGAKTLADSTNELATKLLAVTNPLLKNVETINILIAKSFRLVHSVLAVSQIQVQNELQQADFIGFEFFWDLIGGKHVNKDKWLSKDFGCPITDLNILKTPFIHPLQSSISDRQGIKKGQSIGLQVMLSSFCDKNYFLCECHILRLLWGFVLKSGNCDGCDHALIISAHESMLLFANFYGFIRVFWNMRALISFNWPYFLLRNLNSKRRVHSLIFFIANNYFRGNWRNRVFSILYLYSKCTSHLLLDSISASIPNQLISCDHTGCVVYDF